jgi:hypothetical protein
MAVGPSLKKHHIGNDLLLVFNMICFRLDITMICFRQKRSESDVILTARARRDPLKIGQKSKTQK